jgi:DNA polymerase epsilon subunit 2
MSHAGQGSLCVFGLLSELEDGQFYIEDDDVQLKIDLSQCVPSDGLYCENVFVLAEGVMQDQTLLVRALGFPLAEARKRTLYQFPKLDFVPPQVSLPYSVALPPFSFCVKTHPGS